MSSYRVPTCGFALSSLHEAVAPLEVRYVVEPLDEEVRFVEVVFDIDMPLPEIAGGLLLLATSLHDPERAISSVTEAARCGFVGIVVRDGQSDLDRIKAVAAEYSLAVLAIREGVTWHSLKAALEDALVWSAGGAQGSSGSPSEELFAIADALAVTIGGSVAIEDLGRQILAYSSLPGQRIDAVRSEGILARRVPDAAANEESYRRVLESHEVIFFAEDVGELARLAISIRAGNLVLGSIWAIAGEEGLSDEAGEVLREGTQLAALQMLRARSAADIDQNMRGELLRALLAGEGIFSLNAFRLGFASGEPCALLVLGSLADLQSDRASAMLEVNREVRLLCRALRPDAAVSEAQGAIYILARATPGNLAEHRLANALLSVLNRSASTEVCLAMAFGRAQPESFSNMRAQADEAFRALHSPALSRRIGSFDDLRAEILLMRIHDEFSRDTSLRHQGLDEIAKADPRYGTEVTQSLLAWFQARFDFGDAAAHLHIHPNTLRYRLRRISENGGIDLENPDVCIQLWLQLRSDELFLRP